MYLMKCGHVGQGYRLLEDGSKIPCCAICDCEEIVKECHGTDGLEGRKAMCFQHKYLEDKIVDSSWELPFFKYQPDKEYDSFYCGCWGWD